MTSPAVTNREKIKYLKRYILLDREIDRKLEEVSYWRSRLNKIAALYTAAPIGSQTGQYPVY